MDLKAHLDRLCEATDATARLVADPVAFPHRYTDPRDQEVAALLAAGLAFGRVTSFRPVIAAICDHADAHGGPHAWIGAIDARRDAPIAALYYRWTTGPDLLLWARALGRAYRQVQSLEEWFPVGDDPDVTDALAVLVDRIRDCVLSEAGGRSWRAMSRGIRYLAPSPRGGSACKRWCMWLRWMVRPSGEGVDLGLWRSVQPSQLVIPLDTHVLRVSRFLGLTARRDGSWRTARAITARLAELDPDDPTRYDFAMAHLGISRACRGHRFAPACTRCPLDRVCTAPAAT